MNKIDVTLLYDGEHYRITLPKRTIEEKGWKKGDSLILDSNSGGFSLKKIAPKPAKDRVFSIGYEGKTIDQFIKMLKTVGATQLIDVRENPFSYKEGFSKTPLKEELNQEGIIYHNIRELGTEKQSRDEYKKTGNIEKLCEDFSRRLNSNDDQYQMLIALTHHKPSAIMCFEDDYKTCHRQVIEKKLSQDGYEVIHLCHGRQKKFL